MAAPWQTPRRHSSWIHALQRCPRSACCSIACYATPSNCVAAVYKYEGSNRAPQAYYRRGDANFLLGKFKLAARDFRQAAKLAPNDPDLRRKLAEAEKEVKRIRFEDALSLPVRALELSRNRMLMRKETAYRSDETP